MGLHGRHRPASRPLGVELPQQPAKPATSPASRARSPHSLRVHCACLTAQDCFRVNSLYPTFPEGVQVETGSMSLSLAALLHLGARGGPSPPPHHPDLLLQGVPLLPQLFGDRCTSAPASKFSLSGPSWRLPVLGATDRCKTYSGVFFTPGLVFLVCVSLETRVRVCVTRAPSPRAHMCQTALALLPVQSMCATCSPAQAPLGGLSVKRRGSCVCVVCLSRADVCVFPRVCSCGGKSRVGCLAVGPHRTLTLHVSTCDLSS